MQDLDGRRIDELSALLAVAREGSFLAAGHSLQRHPTIISKRIATLEQRLGVRLLERTTRRVRLTGAGARLVERLGSMTDQIRDAEQEASAGAAELKGTLRIALPASLGRLWLASRLPDFMRRYPALKVEAHLSERLVDLVAEGYDAAVRVGVLADSRLVSRRLGHLRRILCASPDYVREHGLPVAPADLGRHNCLEFTELASFPHWRLSNGERVETVVARGSLRSNDSSALLDAARAGIGILGAGEWLTVQDLAVGTLVPVLPGWCFDGDGGVYLVRPSAQHALARTEAFVGWISELFGPGMPWERRA